MRVEGSLHLWVHTCTYLPHPSTSKTKQVIDRQEPRFDSVWISGHLGGGDKELNFVCILRGS